MILYMYNCLFVFLFRDSTFSAAKIEKKEESIPFRLQHYQLVLMLIYIYIHI